MSTDKARVEKLIRDAFHGVTLGAGIGLHEGVGLDEYAASDTLAMYRKEDERENWAAISSQELNDYSTSLCYFDAEGMRFHLPAFLINELNDWHSGYSMVFRLTYIMDDDPRFRLLTSDQKRAVREFLLYTLSTLSEPALGFEGPSIEAALNGRWRLPD